MRLHLICLLSFFALPALARDVGGSAQNPCADYEGESKQFCEAAIRSRGNLSCSELADAATRAICEANKAASKSGDPKKACEAYVGEQRKLCEAAISSGSLSCSDITDERTRTACEAASKKSGGNGVMRGALRPENLLKGDARYSCEALVCLTSLKLPRPEECIEPVWRFFFKNFLGVSWLPIVARTESGKIDFLLKCPMNSVTSAMTSFIRAVARGAGKCDAENLNRDLAVWENGYLIAIRNGMPEYCTTYIGHEYVDKSGYVWPRYVGEYGCKGFWAEGADYERAVAAYNAKRAACGCLCW